MCDPEFRKALARHGYALNEDGGGQLAPYVGRFSQRASQIARNVDRYEADWRTDHPGQEPGPRLRQSWDRRAWADARPDKVVPTDGAALVTAWNEELHDLGFRAPIPTGGREPGSKNLDRSTVHGPSIGVINRDVAVELILTRLGSKRSAWNAADIRGEAEKLTATLGIVAQRAARTELTEDITSRAVAACRRLLNRTDAPEHVRTLTSDRVLAVEAELNDRLATRAEHPVQHVAS